MKAIINARIYDYEKYIENGYVVFDKKIIKVGKTFQILFVLIHISIQYLLADLLYHLIQPISKKS